MRQGVSVNTLYGVGKIIGSSSRMWEFYGYYRNRNISDDEYINYSEKDIVMYFIHVMNCLNMLEFRILYKTENCV